MIGTGTPPALRNPRSTPGATRGVCAAASRSVVTTTPWRRARRLATYAVEGVEAVRLGRRSYTVRGSRWQRPRTYVLANPWSLDSVLRETEKLIPVAYGSATPRPACSGTINRGRLEGGPRTATEARHWPRRAGWRKLQSRVPGEVHLVTDGSRERRGRARARGRRCDDEDLHVADAIEETAASSAASVTGGRTRSSDAVAVPSRWKIPFSGNAAAISPEPRGARRSLVIP